MTDVAYNHFAMNPAHHPYWFHAKRYGWGWGLPAAWQGWIVLVAWLTAVLVISPALALQSMVYFAVFMVLMTGALLAMFFAKGEPPKWPWGDR